MEEFICIRECYYGEPGFRKLYKPGERLRASKAGKHFVRASEFHGEEQPVAFGKDDRTTLEILGDLKRKYGIKLDPESTSKATAYAAWLKAEAKSGKPFARREVS